MSYYKNIKQFPTILTYTRPYNKSFLDIKLANGLKEVTELIVRINDNETHLMQVLSKHIKNPQLHKDLRNSSTWTPQ